jgi:hypothetical protein
VKRRKGVVIMYGKLATAIHVNVRMTAGGEGEEP